MVERKAVKRIARSVNFAGIELAFIRKVLELHKSDDAFIDELAKKAIAKIDNVGQPKD